MLPLDQYRAERLAALEAEDGWLNLTDRVDLPPGRSRVGSGAENEVQLQGGPDHLGVLALQGDSATFETPDGRVLAFQPAAGGFPQLRLPPFLLELHTVDGVPALRVRDLTLPRKAVLHHFPFDPAFVITARWERLETPGRQTIGQKGGADTEVPLTHVARFTFAGHEIGLLPTHWKGGKPMFVIRDATSGRETYGASRFLMGEDMTETSIVLDFNRAFTPPCGFTDFAICPLPPRANILPFAVTAGERLC